MPFGIVAYALMLFSWTTFLETAVYLVWVMVGVFIEDSWQVTLNVAFSHVTVLEHFSRLVLQAIAKRVETLSVIGYVLGNNHCFTCFPFPPHPVPLSMLNEIRNDIQPSIIITIAVVIIIIIIIVNSDQNSFIIRF